MALGKTAPTQLPMSHALMAKPIPEPPEDAISAARLGRPEGIASLYSTFAAQLLRTAQRVTGSTADAEDIVHDIFVGLPHFLSRYQERGQLGAWLKGLTIKLAVAKARKDSRRDRLLAIFARGVGSASVAESDSSWRLDLNSALQTLPFSLRSVFVLRFLEEESYEEIASQLSISPGAARARYLRALRHLRRSAPKSL